MPTIPLLVSVRIITCNHVAFISQAIDSALAQITDFELEIIIGDDASTDGTAEICRRYAAAHPGRIRLYERQAADRIFIDGDQTGRHNWLETTRACRGQFIALLDGDDYWTDPFKLQQQIDCLLSHPEAVLCGHDYRYLSPSGKDLGRVMMRCGRYPTAMKMLGSSVFQTSTVVYRNVTGPFPPEIKEVITGDIFLVSMLSRFGSAVYLPDIQPSVYRLHVGSMWTSMPFRKRLRHVLQCRRALSSWFKRTLEAGALGLVEAVLDEREREWRAVYSENPFSLAALKLRLNHFQLHYMGNRLFLIKQWLMRVFMPRIFF